MTCQNERQRLVLSSLPLRLLDCFFFAMPLLADTFDASLHFGRWDCASFFVRDPDIGLAYGAVSDAVAVASAMCTFDYVDVWITMRLTVALGR